MTIKIFTDGSCLGNPGSGGWAAIFNFDKEIKKFCGTAQNVTNNRMELLAVLKALEEIERIELKRKKHNSYIIYCDSAYVVNSIVNKWVDAWIENGWKTKKKESVKNKDLWLRILTKRNFFDKNKINVQFKKVKGHSGDVFNELADKIANEQATNAKKNFKEKKKK